VPKNQKAALIVDLQKSFLCWPLDIRAASIASDLWAEFKKQPRVQSPKGRDVLKADALIVASARAANAECFYSHDEGCRNLAELAA